MQIWPTFVNARFDEDLILEESRLYSMQLDNVTFAEESTINLNNADFTKFVVHWTIIKDRLDVQWSSIPCPGEELQEPGVV